MTLILEVPDSKKAALEAKAEARGISAEQYAEQVLNLDLEDTEDRPSISAIIRQIWSDLPDDARAKLRAEGPDRIDHYVYGMPKVFGAAAES